MDAAPNRRRPVVTVVGPTAAGKSALAVGLAGRLVRSGRLHAVEVVNADSMQLYRGMDIGTAKITAAERGTVVHHLLDVWPISKSAAVAEYQAMARSVIDDIHRRGALPVLVGGSGLYVRATIDRLDFPGESPVLRAALSAELDQHGAPALHARLRRLDAQAAESILPTNGRRIVRALEVIELTGGPFRARMPGFDSIYSAVQIGLDRTDLDDRVDRRVTEMLAHGLLEEVVALCRDGMRGSPTAGKALGYAQLLSVVDDAGRVSGSLDEAVALTQRATRRFVRRQRSWFRRDPRIEWLDGSSELLIERAGTLVEAKLGR